MFKNSTGTSLLILSLVMLVVFFRQSRQIYLEIGRIQSSDLKEQAFTIDGSYDLADSALQVENKLPEVKYTGDFTPPFRGLNVKPRPRNPVVRVSAPPKPPRQELRLKGILMRDSIPLAILEDGGGETFIRKAGDNVHDQTVQKIISNTVHIRDDHGTYELTIDQ